MKGYFKTHCLHTCGGQLWLKFIIALGELPATCVDAVNDIIDRRTVERRGVNTTQENKAPDAKLWMRREDRASMPVDPNYRPRGR